MAHVILLAFSYLIENELRNCRRGICSSQKSNTFHRLWLEERVTTVFAHGIQMEVMFFILSGSLMLKLSCFGEISVLTECVWCVNTFVACVAVQFTLNAVI